MMLTNINVQTLITEAILTENHEYIYYAAMMDPHTAAVLGIDEIYALIDDLIESHGDWLPAWHNNILLPANSPVSLSEG
jgi:alpha-galactosidase